MNRNKIENLIKILFHPKDVSILLNYLNKGNVNKLRILVSDKKEETEREFNILKTQKTEYNLKLFNELEDLILYELELV